MGAFDDIPEVIIPRSEEERKKWGWEPHEQVILKGSITVEDQEHMLNNQSKAGKKGVVETQEGTAKFSLMERMILSWTFTRNGQPVPKNRVTVRQLPLRYSLPILQTIDEIAETMTEEEQEDFLTSANGHISETSRLTR